MEHDVSKLKEAAAHDGSQAENSTQPTSRRSAGIDQTSWLFERQRDHRYDIRK
jgi:hypothetical protein